MSPSDILRDLRSSGLLPGVEGEPDRAIAPRTPGAPWDPVAMALSVIVPGSSVWITKHSITVTVGKNVPIRICSEEEYLRSAPTVERVWNLTGKRPPLPMGGCMRHLLNWIGPADYLPGWHTPEPRDSIVLDGIRGNGLRYHDCQPGEYPYGELWDITGCYGQLLERLPSLYARVDAGRGAWFVPMPVDMSYRWKEALSLVTEDREARLHLWGVALGSQKPGSCNRWKDGERDSPVLPPGPFPTAAKLVARAAWELTALGSRESGGVYSNTDCVILPYDSGGRGPEYWQRFGIRSRMKASGPAHIVREFCYKVGDTETHPYTERENIAHWRKHSPRLPRMPEGRLWHRDFL